MAETDPTAMMGTGTASVLKLMYCRCERCGKPVILAYSPVRNEYYAVCEPCQISMAIPKNPNFLT